VRRCLAFNRKTDARRCHSLDSDAGCANALNSYGVVCRSRADDTGYNALNVHTASQPGSGDEPVLATKAIGLKSSRPYQLIFLAVCTAPSRHH